jgi:hypothetical protein
MVKPPLRRKSIGFKVSEEEYAQLETAAQTSGRTLGEWCREVVLASASDVERGDPALAEIVGMRLLLVNVLGPVAAGEKVTPERFNRSTESRDREAVGSVMNDEVKECNIATTSRFFLARASWLRSFHFGQARNWTVLFL